MPGCDIIVRVPQLYARDSFSGPERKAMVELGCGNSDHGGPGGGDAKGAIEVPQVPEARPRVGDEGVDDCVRKLKRLKLNENWESLATKFEEENEFEMRQKGAGHTGNERCQVDDSHAKMTGNDKNIRIMKKDLLNCTTLGDNEGETRVRDDTVGGVETSAQVMAMNANNARKDSNATGDGDTKG